jgi:hypothetical protein
MLHMIESHFTGSVENKTTWLSGGTVDGKHAHATVGRMITIRTIGQTGQDVTKVIIFTNLDIARARLNFEIVMGIHFAITLNKPADPGLRLTSICIGQQVFSEIPIEYRVERVYSRIALGNTQCLTFTSTAGVGPAPDDAVTTLETRRFAIDVQVFGPAITGDSVGIGIRACSHGTHFTTRNHNLVPNK